MDQQLLEPNAEAEQNAVEFLSHTIYFEGTPAEVDIDRLRALNLVEMLDAEIARDDWDFRRIRSILLGFRLTRDEGAVDAIAGHFDLLLPFVKEIVFLVDELRRQGKAISNQLRSR